MEAILSIILGSFILEDVALASAVTLSSVGELTWLQGYLAIFLGISMGDLGVFALGVLARQTFWKAWFPKLATASKKFETHRTSPYLTATIFFCRFIPGTRTLTYMGAGYLGYPIVSFLLVTTVSVFLWVSLAFLAGEALTDFFRAHWVWGAVALLAVLGLIKFAATMLRDPWSRRAFLPGLRKWRYFEFWPALLFYLPIVPLYTYLMIRHRSPWMPFYANPNLKHGGLIGESKWDFLKWLDVKNPARLEAIRVQGGGDFAPIEKQMLEAGLIYPLIFKPDVGQRGFGVRIIRGTTAAAEYLKLAKFEVIIQRLSQFEKEAGLFYVREPGALAGQLFSITDKDFPFVTGDGKRSLGDLILADTRARMIAKTYFARWQNQLDSIPAAGEVVALSECGNHCQGAIFRNGEALKTAALLTSVEAAVSPLPDFYFGRLDVRYRDHETLMAGRDFEIVEINGAGSEATHIWDARTSLVEAYRVLIRQWSLLFRVGAYVRATSPKHQPVRFGVFLLDAGKVYFRKSPLSVSS